MVLDMVEKAKSQKSTLAIILWDTVNGYGSIPLFLAFAHWIRLVQNYCKLYLVNYYLSHIAGFLMKVFACITSQPYLVLSLFNFC